MKDGAEEDVWKRHGFGNDPLLMGHTKPNRFSHKNRLAVSFARHCSHMTLEKIGSGPLYIRRQSYTIKFGPCTAFQFATAGT